MFLLDRPQDKAAEFLREYWGMELPVDPKLIAERAGARVYVMPLDGYSGSFDFEDGVPVIRVNSTEASVRRRFTMAHEVGHFALGHDARLREGADSFTTTNRDPFEIAANRFAADLLMPEPAIRYLIHKRNITSINALAAAAQVSEVAMQYRLRNLGIIS